jgi:hypothetical protein
MAFFKPKSSANSNGEELMDIKKQLNKQKINGKSKFTNGNRKWI